MIARVVSVTKLPLYTTAKTENYAISAKDSFTAEQIEHIKYTIS